MGSEEWRLEEHKTSRGEGEHHQQRAMGVVVCSTPRGVG